MHADIMIAVALAALGLGGRARAQAPAGGLVLSGSSTVGDWTCREATIQPATASADAHAVRPPAARPGMTLTFPVHDIDCGNASMNDQLQHALQADRHPAISFELQPNQLQRVAGAGSAPIALDGTLTIAGRSEPVRTQVVVTQGPGDALRVKGEQSLLMSAFGVRPPHLLFGALKVRDLVHVVFDFVLHRPTLALPGGMPMR